MNRENLIWVILFVVGGLFLAGRAMLAENGMGKAYVKEKIDERYLVEEESEFAFENERLGKDETWYGAEKAEEILNEQGTSIDSLPPEKRHTLKEYQPATFREFKEYEAQVAANGGTAPAGVAAILLSPERTVGIWFAAFMTICVMTFLIKDNPFYKTAEAIFIGVSAAYWMVVGFWTTVVPNLIGKLVPGVVRDWALPGLGKYEPVELMYLIPLGLGVMLLWRLAPKGGWISRWPMAFIIGVFCGLRLVTFLHADFLSQINGSVISLWGTDANGNFDIWESLRSLFIIAGVLTCLVYFFFSIEHKGMVGKTARVGIWFLMITFGAAFGYTVMGRIALLAIRFEFLFDDWLWLIDPKGNRAVEEVAILMPAVMSATGLA